jgi:hypothetical protein
MDAALQRWWIRLSFLCRNKEEWDRWDRRLWAASCCLAWLHLWVGCMQRFSATCIYTNTGYGRSIHTAKVTRVAYAPTYAGYGIQSSSCYCDARRQGNSVGGQCFQALNCISRGECLNGDAELVPSGVWFLVSAARNLLSGCRCSMREA